MNVQLHSATPSTPHAAPAVRTDPRGAEPAEDRAAVGIGAVAYAFPAAGATVEELAARGLLASEPALLRRFGFGRVHTAVGESPYGLAVAAAREVLASSGADPASVGLVLYGGAAGPTAFAAARSMAESAAAHHTMARFRYPGTRLQHELGLENAQVLGLDQLACTTLLGAVRVARAFCLAEGVERVLCVAADFFPAGAGREALFNCTSDAAVALLVERGPARGRIRSLVQLTHGYYWDPDALQSEMVAAYFPTSQRVIQRTVAEAGWTLADVDWVIPHNVAERSWRILAGLAGLKGARIWNRNLARDGHTLAGDNFINLADALASGEVRPGQRLLLFSFGYGAHWTGLSLEV